MNTDVEGRKGTRECPPPLEEHFLNWCYDTLGTRNYDEIQAILIYLQNTQETEGKNPCLRHNLWCHEERRLGGCKLSSCPFGGVS